MKLLKLHLVNVRAHEDVTVDFNGCSTMVLGHNGSGKSTIVESIYYALFRKLLVANADVMVTDKIKKVSEDGKISYLSASYIELQIESNGKEYLIKSPLAKTTCSLKVLEGDQWVEKINKLTEMYEYIRVHILEGMTAEYFINTVYTEQMGILRLVSKEPVPRQQEFDKLIGIDRFQKLHTAVGNSFTILNRAKRDDVHMLKESVMLKSSNITGLEMNKKSLDSEHHNLITKKETIYATYDTKRKLCEDVEMKSKAIYEDYVEANNLSTRHRENNTLLQNANNELSQLESSVPLKEMKMELDTLVGSLKINYDDICDQTTEVFNYIDSEKKKIESNINVVDKDIKTLEMLAIYTRSLADAKNKFNFCQKSLLEKSANLKEFETLFEKYSKDVQTVEDTIKDIKENIRNNEFSIQTLLKDFNNCNYNFESVKAFMDSDDDSYDGFDKDSYHCSYCGSEVKKENMLERLIESRKTYISANQEINRLRDELMTKEQVLSLVKSERDKLSLSISSLKSGIGCDRMLMEESMKKIQDTEVEISKRESNLVNVGSLVQLKQVLDGYKKDLIKLTDEIDLRPLYPYKGVSKSTIAKLNDLTILCEIIEAYQNDLKRHKSLENSISSYQIKHDTLTSHIAKFKQLVDSIYPKIVEKIKAHSCENLTELYEKVKASQEYLNSIKVDLASVANEVSTIDQLISANRKHCTSLDIQIKDLEAEIQVLRSTIETDKIISKRIEMVNVAKSYFKHDGLAKDIRKYYIDSINANMANYIGTFGFTFTPKIDDTAGIENYEKYSGGQKISIAILEKMILNFILKNPINIMILDEPTPYMDEERIEAIKELVNSIKSKVQLILITHEKDFMTIDCNRVVFGNSSYE